MKTLPVAEVKARFSVLLAEVAQGGVIAITRKGRVVARLVPEAPGMAANAFRPFWTAEDIDLEAPADNLPEPVPPLE